MKREKKKQRKRITNRKYKVRHRNKLDISTITVEVND